MTENRFKWEFRLLCILKARNHLITKDFSLRGRFTSHSAQACLFRKLLPPHPIFPFSLLPFRISPQDFSTLPTLSCRAVFLNRGWLCSPGAIWQPMETFGFSQFGGELCNRLVSWGWVCCCTSYHAQESAPPPHRITVWTNMPTEQKLRNRDRPRQLSWASILPGSECIHTLRQSPSLNWRGHQFPLWHVGATETLQFPLTQAALLRKSCAFE